MFSEKRSFCQVQADEALDEVSPYPHTQDAQIKPKRVCRYPTTYYILLVKGPSNTTSVLSSHRWADHSLSFPGSQLSCQIRVHPPGGVPSYLIRVWPGGQGHHVVPTGLARRSSQNRQRRLPAHLMQWQYLQYVLDCNRYQCRFYILVIGLVLDQGKCQSQQLIKCCPHDLSSVEGVGTGRSFSPLLGPGTKISKGASCKSTAFRII